MNLVIQQSFSKIIPTKHPFQSSNPPTSNLLKLNPKISKKSSHATKENSTQRKFGKELQNTEPQQESTCPKERMTPSTLNSTLQSEPDSMLSLSPMKRRNPQLVKPYKKRIRDFLHKRDKFDRIDLKFLSVQNDINSKMRAILIDWLVDVSVKFKLIDITLFSTITVLDKFLQARQVHRQNLQLLGVTCLMIVAKFEEIYPPSITDYVCVCDKAYTQEQLLDSEADVLQTLKFDLAVTPSIVFYKDLVQDTPFSAKTISFGAYILEISLLDPLSRKYSNKELACGSIYLVNKIFKCGQNWKTELAEICSGLTEAKVKSCAKELYRVLSQMSGSSLSAVKRKYATAEMFEVSKYKVERAFKNKSQ
jgi:cyclin B